MSTVARDTFSLSSVNRDQLIGKTHCYESVTRVGRRGGLDVTDQEDSLVS